MFEQVEHLDFRSVCYRTANYIREVASSGKYDGIGSVDIRIEMPGDLFHSDEVKVTMVVRSTKIISEYIFSLSRFNSLMFPQFLFEHLTSEFEDIAQRSLDQLREMQCHSG